ncbi:MAG: hypothetical protein ACTSXP_01700, partial [Promethearchaeota archaeon]
MVTTEDLISKWYPCSWKNRKFKKDNIDDKYCFKFDEKILSVAHGDLEEDKDKIKKITSWIMMHEEEFNKNPKKIHLGLYPVPYFGSLKNASVFIVALNPGIVFLDYFMEYDDIYSGIFVERLELAISQEFPKNYDYPFIYLDPDLCFHPGYSYWMKIFGNIIEKISSDNKDMNRSDAIKFLAQNIAVLELIPYHSQKRPQRNKTLDNLESTKLMVNY